MTIKTTAMILLAKMMVMVSVTMEYLIIIVIVSVVGKAKIATKVSQVISL